MVLLTGTMLHSGSLEPIHLVKLKLYTHWISTLISPPQAVHLLASMAPIAHLFVFPERQWQRLCRGLLFLWNFLSWSPSFSSTFFSQELRALCISTYQSCWDVEGGWLWATSHPLLPSGSLHLPLRSTQVKAVTRMPTNWTLWHHICDTGHCYKLDLV